MLFCDNGSEFTGQMMDLWAYRNDVKIDFSRPGKPTVNAFCESFNGTFRAECLDTNWFQTLPEARPSSRPGDVNTMRVVLTEPRLTGRHQSSPVRSRLAAI
jgi:transposase InsO family protein